LNIRRTLSACGIDYLSLGYLRRFDKDRSINRTTVLTVINRNSEVCNKCAGKEISCSFIANHNLFFMKRILINTLSVITLLYLFGCQKELSYETNVTPSKGSLQSDASDECLPKVVSGFYIAGTSLNDSNFITVDVNVSKTGSYTIATDTINGYFFRGTGNFTATGINIIKLIGQGTPTLPGINTLEVSFDSTFCFLQVTVLPAGSGGPAVLTLEGSGGSCLDALVQGTYVKNTALNGTNKVDIKVNVTTIGTYNISTTPINGMTFSGTGALAVTGVQIVTLTGSGTPVNSGSITVSITAGGTSCTFPVVVTDAAPPLLDDYFPRTVNSNWSYDYDDDLSTPAPTDTLLQKVISQTFASSGNTYNIFMITDDASAGFDTAGYYRRSGGDYYLFTEMGNYLGLDSNSQWMEFIFLKDNQPVGTAWNTNQFVLSQLGLSFTLRIAFTILQKDISVTVNGVTYPNTIIVQEKYEQFAGGTWNDMTPSVGYYKNYYAKGVGLIKWESFDGTGTMDVNYQLTRSNIY
jgi:hypothetical protein